MLQGTQTKLGATLKRRCTRKNVRHRLSDYVADDTNLLHPLLPRERSECIIPPGVQTPIFESVF